MNGLYKGLNYGLTSGLYESISDNGMGLFTDTVIKRKFIRESEIFFSYQSPTPSPGQKTFYDRFWFRPLVYSGIIKNLDRLFVGNCESFQNMSISLANPSSTPLSTSSPGAFTPLSGVTFNGTSQYADTNWKPSDGVNFELNSNASFIYIANNTQTNADYGTYTGAGLNQMGGWARFTDDKFYGIANSTSFDSITNTDSRGLHYVERTNASTVNLYKNGILGSSFSKASTGRSTLNCYLGCRNRNGVAGDFSNHTIYIFGVGSSRIPQALLYNIIQNSLISIGKQV